MFKKIVLLVFILLWCIGVLAHNTHYGEQWEYSPFYFRVESSDLIGSSPKEVCDAYSSVHWEGVATKVYFVENSPLVRCLTSDNTNNIGPKITPACRSGTPIAYVTGFSAPGISVGGVSCHCPNGSYFNSSYNWCVAEGYEELGCPVPYLFNENDVRCEAYCKNGDVWDEDSSSCITPPQEQSCKDQSANPIDFTQGYKYRTEPVLQAGIRYPFGLNYFFSNQGNHEKTVKGTVGVFSTDRYLAATVEPMPSSDYSASFNNNGVAKDAPGYLASQYYGAIKQYWRHSYDDVLQILNEEYVYHLSSGKNIRFSNAGASSVYPTLRLQPLAQGEEIFDGYKISNAKTNLIKKFDNNGRLMKLEKSALDVLTLTYSAAGLLQRITNSEGAYIELAYELKSTHSIYNVEASAQHYPTIVTNNIGDTVELKWNHAYQGQTATFHMLTHVSKPFIDAPIAAREFEYNNTDFSASITDIYDVHSIQNNRKTQYAHFSYDNKGRATTSGLTNGYEGVTVTYPSDTQTIVTNSLGKKAQYNYADFNGVKRLQSLIGEATNNCAQSNTVYDYYDNGNLKTTIQNGVVTHYQYNEKNQKTVTTKAQGTAMEFVSKTCWHTTHNKPERIIEPSNVTVFEYFDNGQLKNKKVETRSEENAVCP